MYAYLVVLQVMTQMESYVIPVAGSFEGSSSTTKSKAIDFHGRGGVVGDFMSLYGAWCDALFRMYVSHDATTSLTTFLIPGK